MTKQGSFKRAVRQLAHATGQRYSEARTVVEQAGGRRSATPAPSTSQR